MLKRQVPSRYVVAWRGVMPGAKGRARVRRDILGEDFVGLGPDWALWRSGEGHGR